MTDPYHPRYPSADKDYFERLMWFAAVLQEAKRQGFNYLSCNKDDRERVEAVIGKPHFDTVRV